MKRKFSFFSSVLAFGAVLILMSPSTLFSQSNSVRATPSDVGEDCFMVCGYVPIPKEAVLPGEKGDVVTNPDGSVRTCKEGWYKQQPSGKCCYRLTKYLPPFCRPDR